MGKVLSIASKKINRFNVENRAHRFLDKQKSKPIAAPKFDSDKKAYQKILQDYPEQLDQINKKNDDLDSRLKQVYVTSKTFRRNNANNRLQQTNADHDARQRVLPSDRKPIEVFEYGFKESVVIPKDKCTLRQSMEFIANSQHNPDVWTTEFISERYQIKKEIIEKILKNFRTFELYIPENIGDSVKESTRLMFAHHDIILEDDDNSHSNNRNDKLNKLPNNDSNINTNTKQIEEVKK